MKNNSKPSYTSFQLISILVFQQILGAFTFPVAKYGLDFIEPFTFAFFRYLLSSTVLLIIVTLRKYDIPIDKKDYKAILFLGFLIIPFNQTLFLWGQSLTGVGHGSVIFATVPIWIFLAALFILKEKIIWRQAVGIAVAMIGIGVIISEGAIGIGTEYLFGDFLILICVLAWASYTVLGKPLVEKYGALRVTAYAISSGSAMYFPFGLYRALSFDYVNVPPSAWWSIIYVAIGTSVICYVLWYWVLKYMDASRIAVYHNMQPLLATSVAFVWLGEPVGTTFIVGGLIAIGGVIIAET